MLVSTAVSENVVPGIAKVLENYLATFSMDDVISNPNKQRNMNFKIKKGRVVASENWDFPFENEAL